MSYVGPEVERQALEFILDRAKFVLRERLGFAYDEVNAAFGARADDLVDAVKRLEALRAIRHTRNFEPLAVSFKRIRKILEKAGPEQSWRLPAAQPERFIEEGERHLHLSAQRAAKTAEDFKRAGKYREALEAIAALRPAVDRFFDEVLVMADDQDLRKNRLTLLADLLREFSTIADFSEIVVQERPASS